MIDRSIYTIAFPDQGWNGRLVYRFGGGCGTSYSQGSSFVNAVDPALLQKGYAVVTSTLNTYQSVCNEVLSAEVALMTKEHFIEKYGVPDFTIGEGGSGGAIQQIQIAQNYPGILDAIAPAVPFPDAISTAADRDGLRAPAALLRDAERRSARSRATTRHLRTPDPRHLPPVGPHVPAQHRPHRRAVIPPSRRPRSTTPRPTAPACAARCRTAPSISTASIPQPASVLVCSTTSASCTARKPSTTVSSPSINCWT